MSLAIASVAVLEGPAPTRDEVAAMIAGRLPRVPRYRQKVRTIPADLGPPVWVDDPDFRLDDPDFRLDDHVRETALPAPGGDAELAAAVADLMSSRLDRRRPLWEYWLVGGLADGRWALLTKVHHCMVDGISGTDLYHAVLDPSPEPSPPLPDRWRPAPEPSTAWLTVSALAALAQTPAVQLRALAGALRRPGALVTDVLDTLRGWAALATALVPAHASSLSGPIGGRRAFAFSRGTVEDVAAVRRRVGGTFNDVVLAAVTAGFRRLLLARGEVADGHAVRTLVPVNVRAPGEESIRDNRVSLMLAELPVHVVDPLERLEVVRARLDALKRDHEAEAGVALTSLAALAPFPLVAGQVRWLAAWPQRSVVTVTTDVPGPRAPLHALGRPVLEIVPYVPLASTARVGVSIFSYLDRICFGVTGDRDTAPDVDVLARGIAEGLGQLAAVTAAADPG